MPEHITPGSERDGDRWALAAKDQELDRLEAEVERLREQHERDLIHVREAHAARRLAEAAYERLRGGSSQQRPAGPVTEPGGATTPGEDPEAERDLEERVARAIWDAMVNDEPPIRADLELYGYIDAARAAIQEVLRG